MRIFLKLFNPSISINQGVLIMEALKMLQDAVAKLAADAAAEKVETDANVAESQVAISALTDNVAALQAQLANGTQVTAADLQTLTASVTAIDAAVTAISTPAPAPVPVPTV